jgi:polysaccharide pyruvyl transferase WcaK-like protein
MLDRYLIESMDRVIHRARQSPARRFQRSPDPRKPLKLLFAGYTGAYNMGSDVRVQEMIRQFGHLIGNHRFQAAVFQYEDPKASRYFGEAQKLRPSLFFPRYLERVVPRFDGVVACEGSTFKSQFTDLLSAMMVGAMGLASAHGKISIAYAAEAGKMSPRLTELVMEHCRDSLIVTRSQQSSDRLATLGLSSTRGTDTAWTFEPLPAEYGRRELHKQGWRGEPILLICPVNPFWWPVRASLPKSLARLFGCYRNSHYARVLFFQSGREVNERFDGYLDSIARAVRAFCQRSNYFPVVAASERVDRLAVEKLSSRLGGTPQFHSCDYDIRQFVSVLRNADLLISSRYHPVVTTMPARVVAGAISIDERLSNLMHNCGCGHLLVNADQEDLEQQLYAMLQTMWRSRLQIQEALGTTVVRELRKFSEMGRSVRKRLCESYPRIADSPEPSCWCGFLPPLSHSLQQLIEAHPDVGTAAVTAVESPTDLMRQPEF